MSAHDDAQSNRREQRNQPSRLTRSRRLRWLGGRSRSGEQAERPSQGGSTPQVGGSIPGIQPLEMAAADFGSLRAQHSSVRPRGSALVNQADDVIHLYPLCDSCLARSEVHGTAPALDDAGLYRGVW